MNKEEKNAEKFFKSLTNYAEETNKEIERLNNIINELEKVLNEEVMLRYHGKDNAKENKIFNEGGMLYRDYIIDKLKELKEGKNSHEN